MARYEGSKELAGRPLPPAGAIIPQERIKETNLRAKELSFGHRMYAVLSTTRIPKTQWTLGNVWACLFWLAANVWCVRMTAPNWSTAPEWGICTGPLHDARHTPHASPPGSRYSSCAPVVKRPCVPVPLCLLGDATQALWPLRTACS